MKNVLNELEAAFNIVSTISVKGDDVDAMAVVRNKLKKAYKELQAKSKNESES